MKAKVKLEKRGSKNTHYVIRVGLASIGKIYLPNDIADLNEEIKEFELELPFKEA